MSEYRFDRYRNGRRMAEGLVLTKPTSVDQAVAVAAALAQAGEIFVLRQDCRIAELEAERDAAKAGEARAVEALKGLLNELHEFDFEIDGSVEFFDSVQQCRDATDNTQPALAWLAQQRREAVVAELRDWAEQWWESHSDFSAGDFNARIAALRTQQPTACPRSEVRAEENNNA